MSVADFLAAHGQRLVEVRRDLHAHPELSREERRTTGLVADALRHAGLAPRVLPGGTGMVCDVGGPTPRVALRADLDALPVTDTKDVGYRSTVAGVAHACGHDVHTAIVLGAGLALQRLAQEGALHHGVRLIFQPAEEVVPGGALDVVAADGLDGIARIYAVHCDPTIDAGKVGLRPGPITAASDHVEVRLGGPGGHTARPHLTADLVTAMGAVITQVPALLGRRVDPRAGVALVWGQASAGTAANAIPESGVVRGTLRTLSREHWQRLPAILDELVQQVAGPYGVTVETTHTRGVPPVVNDPACVDTLAAAAWSALGPDAVTGTEQSLGGEDFAWYLERVPGALARLGVRSPGSSVHLDLHQSGFDVDERCISVGVQLLVHAALAGDSGEVVSGADRAAGAGA